MGSDWVGIRRNKPLHPSVQLKYTVGFWCSDWASGNVLVGEEVCCRKLLLFQDDVAKSMKLKGNQEFRHGFSSVSATLFADIIIYNWLFGLVIPCLANKAFG